MGSPISPTVANLFMEDFEDKALASSTHLPKVWFRYGDDTFTIMKKTYVELFSDHLNQVNHNIKFTREEEDHGKIEFLDSDIKRCNDSHLELSVYRKPTHTDQYLNFHSHHPLNQKLGVVRTLLHRCNTIVNTEAAKEEERDRKSVV